MQTIEITYQSPLESSFSSNEKCLRKDENGCRSAANDGGEAVCCNAEAGEKHGKRGCVCTIGHFDGVHLGHQYVINRMHEIKAERGLGRTVAVTFDRHPRTLFDASFQPKMLSTIDERRILLSHTGVDACAVLRFDREMASMSAREFMEEVLLKQLDTRVLLLGYDNRFGKINAEEGFSDYVKYGQELGIEVIACDALRANGDQNVSSTMIRELLSDGFVDVASEFLGHPYTVEGTVVEGFHEGRKLGFPTANMEIDAQKLIPVGGVYAVKVRVEGSMTSLHGMMNIGHRPTYGSNKLTLEVNIFRFNEDIYGKRLRVEFYKRLRNERFFDSVYKLTEQLKEDSMAADHYLCNLLQE